MADVASSSVPERTPSDRMKLSSEKYAQLLANIHPHSSSIQLMNAFISSFWSTVASELPILHPSTFDTVTISTQLLLAVIVLGAYTHAIKHEDDSTFNFAEDLLERLLSDIPVNSAVLDISTAQTVLLVEVAGMTYFTKWRLEPQRRLFWHVEFLDWFCACNLDCERTDRMLLEGESVDWSQWIKAETFKRTVCAGGIMDRLYDMKFGCGSLGVNFAVLLKIPPWDDRVWLAETSSKWRQQIPRQRVKRKRYFDYDEEMLRDINEPSTSDQWFGRSHVWTKNPNLAARFDTWSEQQISRPISEGDSRMFIYFRYLTEMSSLLPLHDLLRILETAEGQQEDLLPGDIRQFGHRRRTLRAVKLALAILSHVSRRFPEATEYAPSRDPSFYRGWALFYSALVVWSWSYAMQNKTNPQLSIQKSVQEDMEEYLSAAKNCLPANFRPSAIKFQCSCSCLGLLMVLRQRFSAARGYSSMFATSILERCIDSSTRK